ncbi:MAG: hypothetical protein IPL90_07825 [Holophagales bacterium]|nr:hypothetical protein [Holophagales bacterium]
MSGVLTVQDSVGRWRYVQITDYNWSKCELAVGTDPTLEVIHIQITRGRGPAQPSGRLEGRPRRAVHDQRRHRLHLLPRAERQPRAEDLGS